MAPRRTWLDGRVEVLLAELSTFQLDVPREAAAELIEERLEPVAAQLRITAASGRRYVTYDAVRDLARTLAVGVADEAPGANLLAAHRNVPVPLIVLGRTLAGVAEAGQVRRRVAADDEGVPEVLQLVSVFGQLMADSASTAVGVVVVPQAALARAARQLEAATDSLRTPTPSPEATPYEPALMIADAFAHDVRKLRELISEHGRSGGPTSGS